ncbi:hypothetical protein D3C85_14130 [compost metagenome]
MQNTITDKGVILDTDGKPMYELIERSHELDAFVYKPAFGNALLKRVGFLSPVPPRHLNDENYVHDSRPIAWPLVHPYWVVRMSDDANMLMAYVESEADLLVYWPEATEITVFEENVEQYRYNANFPIPAWLDEIHSPDFKVAPHRLGAFRIFNPDEPDLNIIGYGEDVDYAVQLNNHKLEYSTHENEEFQEMYDQCKDGWRSLQIEFYPADTLAKAEAKAKSLTEFHTSQGEIPTDIHF